MRVFLMISMVFCLIGCEDPYEDVSGGEVGFDGPPPPTCEETYQDSLDATDRSSCSNEIQDLEASFFCHNEFCSSSDSSAYKFTSYATWSSTPCEDLWRAVELFESCLEHNPDKE